MAHTCRRPAESISVICRSENRERRDETENRGVTLHPQTLLFQAFLVIVKKGGNNAQHRHSLRALTEQHSQLFQQTEEREKSKTREARRGRDGVKDIDTSRD